MTDECSQNQRNRKESQIPVLRKSKGFNRTGSLKLKNEFRPRLSMPDKSDVSPTNSPAKINLRRHRSLQTLERAQILFMDNDDDDSDKSFSSSCNSVCGNSRHSPFAHNGTTYSARTMKYIHHCSLNVGSEEYLTPTQRANRTIKRLRQMLADAQSELIEKESDIARLTKEIVELRLLKMDNENNDEERYRLMEIDADEDYVDSTNAKNGNISGRYMDVLHEENDISNNIGIEQTTTTNTTSENRGSSPHQTHTSPSLADSGNFEDINYTLLQNVEKEYEKLRCSYDQMKNEHNEKVAQLLNIIETANDRYYTLKPKYGEAELRIKELEKENDALKEKLLQQDELQKMLLHQVYTKKDESEKNTSSLYSNDDKDSKIVSGSSSSFNMTNLLNQLAQTRSELEKMKAKYNDTMESDVKIPPSEAEITLRFLKSAVYYFLTDANNAKDHLMAIQSMLGYSAVEKSNIDKALS